LARDRGWRLLVQLGAEGKQQRFVVGERHPVRLAGVTPHLGDEPGFVSCAGFEPAVAMEHPLHDFLAARLGSRA
jgi:hypothetical protein